MRAQNYRIPNTFGLERSYTKKADTRYLTFDVRVSPFVHTEDLM